MLFSHMTCIWFNVVQYGSMWFNTRSESPVHYHLQVWVPCALPSPGLSSLRITISRSAFLAHYHLQVWVPCALPYPGLSSLCITISGSAFPVHYHLQVSVPCALPSPGLRSQGWSRWAGWHPGWPFWRRWVLVPWATQFDGWKTGSF